MRAHAGASALLGILIASCAHMMHREPPSSVRAIVADRTLESWMARRNSSTVTHATSQRAARRSTTICRFVRITVVCAGSRDVPVATYDLQAALRSGDVHARAVCDSRRYLLDHAGEDAKQAFFPAFHECEL